MAKNYSIQFNPKIDMKLDFQVVAVIFYNKTGKMILPIAMLNEQVTRVIPELECGLTMKRNPEMFYVQITKRYYDECALAKPNFFESSMMHELGHYLHGDLKRGYGEELGQRRHLNDVIHNRVTTEEFEADKFAVSETSKSTVLNGLQFLSQYLLKRPANKEEMEIAQKEITIRKKAIQKML